MQVQQHIYLQDYIRRNGLIVDGLRGPRLMYL